MKCVRQRCQAAPENTVAMASFRPWWASEMTSSTPPSPPGVQGAQEGQPEGAILAGPNVHPNDLPLALGVHRGGNHDVDDAPCFTHLLGQGVQPQVGVGLAAQGPTEEALHHLFEFLADAGDLAPFGKLRTGLEIASQPRALIRSSTRRVETRPAGSKSAGRARCVGMAPAGWESNCPVVSWGCAGPWCPHGWPKRGCGSRCGG